jgi:hypothetical protein
MAPFTRKLTRQLSQADNIDHADDNENGKYDERERIKYPKSRVHNSPEKVTLTR